MKIYIVTSGSYSDYGMDTTFLDKKLAYQYVEKCNECQTDHYDDKEVEVWEIEEDLNKYHYRVDMNKNGDVKRVDFTEYSHKDYYYELDDTYTFYTKSGNKKRAIKIANERRTQLIAENKWGVKEGK